MGTYIEIDGHSVDALKYIEELEAENRRLGDFANAKVQEIKDLRAKLYEYESDTRHQIELREDGFTIQHPLACRPNLFDCRFNAAARAEEDILFHVGPGRYYCSLAGVDNLLIDGPVPDA